MGMMVWKMKQIMYAHTNTRSAYVCQPLNTVPVRQSCL